MRIVSGLLMLAGWAATVPVQAAAPVTLNDLSVDRALELRCTMLAGLIVSEYERGVAKGNRGLGAADLERLGNALAAALAADHGIDAEATRALLKEDFEYFARMRAHDSAKEATRSLDELSATCRPIWTSERPILPTPQAKAALLPDITPPFCFALMASFADAIRQQAKRDTAESMVFARMANRIETQWLAGGGESAALSAALDAFDVPAFDALAERDAEPIILKCQALAGPDA